MKNYSGWATTRVRLKLNRRKKKLGSRYAGASSVYTSTLHSFSTRIVPNMGMLHSYLKINSNNSIIIKNIYSYTA